MSISDLNRRTFLRNTLAAGTVIATGAPFVAMGETVSSSLAQPARKAYCGPNVIIVRFGGGVRRQETLDPANTYCPFFFHELTKRGTLYPHMVIEQLEGVETSHGQGTLYMLTGKYDQYHDVSGRFLGSRFEAKVPTVFEYLRKVYDVPEHQTLIVNGEDRTDEEFYTFSNHHLFGVSYRSNVLSLYRFKTYLLRKQIERGGFPDKELAQKKQDLEKLESLDYRVTGEQGQSAQIEAFWERWRQFYGESGFVNPRGDRLLTELTLRALKELRPKLIMVNFNDPDYVHWGNPAHYTRGIAIIDESIERLVAAVDADAEYRDNTVFVIVPDCGRDNNRMVEVPFQHHFNSKSSHEIFALVFGPGFAKGKVVDKVVQQIDVAPTIAKVMSTRAEFAEGRVLEEAFA